MVLGLGNDIIEIERIEASLTRHGQRFLDRIFTAKEQHYCKGFRDASRHFAGRFAAKEAIVKALGSGITVAISWLDMEIINDPQGKPVVHFSERVRSAFKQPQFLVSISHGKQYATAVALWVR